MENCIDKKHRIMLIMSFCLVVIGLLLCVNYFFVSGIGAADIVANVALLITFGITLWYMLHGYKISSDRAFGIPLFAYSACVIVMVSTATLSISTATPFITASMCTIIVYPVVIAFNQKNAKLCAALFAVIIVAELTHSFIIYFLYGPAGVVDSGTISATMSNIHIFVRTFLTSAMALCYSARYHRLKK